MVLHGCSISRRNHPGSLIRTIREPEMAGWIDRLSVGPVRPCLEGFRFCCPSAFGLLSQCPSRCSDYGYLSGISTLWVPQNAFFMFCELTPYARANLAYRSCKPIVPFGLTPEGALLWGLYIKDLIRVLIKLAKPVSVRSIKLRGTKRKTFFRFSPCLIKKMRVTTFLAFWT